MGGLLHLFYFNQSSMARKIRTHKKLVDGLEAPRNSIELEIESSKGYDAVRDLPIQYSYPVEEDWPEKNSYPTEASMKKLISEEILKESNIRQSAPSIVARLMGMDVLPLERKPVNQPIDKKNDNTGIISSEKERKGRSSVAHFTSYIDSSRQTPLDSFYPCTSRETHRWCSSLDFEKPRPREHPQEEELKKFKKEFKAWQAARFRECSKVVELDVIPTQRLAQENLDKGKMAIYANSRVIGRENPGEPKSLTFKSTSYGRGGLHHRYKSELFPTDQKESIPLRSRSKSIDFEQTSMMNYDERRDNASTRIVVLKPGLDRIHDHKDCWTNAFGTSEGRSSIEDFLAEVKERLKCELQGKNLKKGSVVRGSGNETPFSERPSDPKQIAHHTAKHVRESVTMDHGVNQLRSESTISYRSEIQFNGPGSPQFINKDTRRFLSERLRNVLKRETNSEIPVGVSGRSKSSAVDKERIRLKQSGDTSVAGNEWNHWEIEKDDQDMQTRSFRHGVDNGVFNRELSPRNLMRSLSAPVSGTSFGQLLLEDSHISTGAQIRRKHEGIDNFKVDVRRKKKERFNFKEKVSNFRYSFALRRRLFGKKIQSMTESHGTQCDHVKDIMSGPTVMMNFGERKDNSTEVPPSPASVCSSDLEDLWKPMDYLSPISTADVTPGEGNDMPKVFREISSTLNELRRQLNELENSPEDISIEQNPAEPEVVDLEDQAEAYIQDLLVASGFYHGLSDKLLPRWDPLAKPISNSVFEKVEKSYRKLAEENDNMTKDHTEKKADRKMLLDLLNEALPTLLGPPVTISRFRRKIIGSSMLPPPRGRKLLDSVWEIISVYLYPSAERSYHSLDSMVAHDLGSTPMRGLIDEEITSLGREVECLIIGELVDEILKEM